MEPAGGGELLYTINEQPKIINHLEFTKDNSQFIIISSDQVSIWRIENKQLVNIADYGNGSEIDISPTGAMLAMDHGDGTIWLENLPDQHIIGRLSSGMERVNGLTFSDDGSMLAIRSEKGTASLWRLHLSDLGILTVTPVSPIQPININGNMLFSPDNQFLATSGSYAEIIAWDISNGAMYSLTYSIPNSTVNSIAFSKNGDKLAAVVENQIVMWTIPASISNQ